MMVILLLLFLGSIQHSGAKPSDSNINMNNVKIKTKPGSQHASAMTEQDTSGQCKNIGRSGGILTCDGRKFDMSHIPCNSVRTEIDGNTGITTLFCNGRKIDVSQLKEITGNDGTQTSQTVNNAGPTGTGQCIQCNNYSLRRGSKTFTCDGRKYDFSHIPCNNPRYGATNNCITFTCDGRKVDLSQINPVSNDNDIRGQNGRNIDQNPNVQDFSGQTIRDGQGFSQVQGPDGRGKQCVNGVCHTCRGNQDIRNGKVFCDGKQVGTIDQNQNNPVWTGNDIRGQTFRGQDINQDQTNGFNSNTVRQGDHDHDHDHDLLGPGGKDYDNYDIKDWINWANTIKQLQLFEEKGGKPSAGGEKGGEP